MNVTPLDDRPVTRRAHGLLGPEPVEHRHDRRLGEAAAQRLDGAFEAAGLGGDDAEVERREGSGSAEARTLACRSLRPLMRSPSRFSASAWSARRVSTETSATAARCPAKRLPIAPAPMTHTRFIRDGFLRPACDLIKYRDCHSASAPTAPPVGGPILLCRSLNSRDLGQPVADGPEPREQLLRGHACEHRDGRSLVPTGTAADYPLHHLDVDRPPDRDALVELDQRLGEVVQDGCSGSCT